MCKKLLIAGAILLALVIAVKKLHFDGYVATAWNNIQSAVERQVPTEMKLDQLEYEIGQMESDIQKLADPLTETKFTIELLKKDIAQLNTNIDDGKKALSTWVAMLDSGNRVLTIDGVSYNPRQLSQKVKSHVALCKRLEAQRDAKVKILALNEKKFNTLYQQAEQMATKKREFEVRLAELRAKAEEVKLADISGTVQVDDSRVKRINKGLERIGMQFEKLDIQRKLLESPPFAGANREPEDAQGQEIDLQEVRSYLNGRQEAVQEARRE